jgi:hypothetical protein
MPGGVSAQLQAWVLPWAFRKRAWTNLSRTLPHNAREAVAPYSRTPWTASVTTCLVRAGASISMKVYT